MFKGIHTLIKCYKDEKEIFNYYGNVDEQAGYTGSTISRCYTNSPDL